MNKFIIYTLLFFSTQIDLFSENTKDIQTFNIQQVSPDADGKIINTNEPLRSQRIKLPINGTSIFPISDVEIGMPSKDLMKKYPTDDILFSKIAQNGVLIEGLVMYEISTGQFWDLLCVLVKDLKVEGLSYCYTGEELRQQNPYLDDSGQMIGKLKPLFQQLQKQLGTTFEKKVIYRPLGNTKVRSAMYVWNRKNDVVTLLHTPVALYKEGDMFDCQLNFSPSLGFSSEIATDNLPEDALLWADAMGDNAFASSRRLLLWLIMPVVAAVWVVVRLRKFRH